MVVRLCLPINMMALKWYRLIFMFCFFPVTLPITTESMNWIVVIFVAVVVLAVGFFAIYGRHHYVEPIAHTTGERGEADVLQSC